MRFKQKTLIVVLISLFLVFVPCARVMADPSMMANEIYAEGIVLDVLICRPAGMVASMLGTTFFVVSLPFALPARSIHTTAKKLVVNPFKWTFIRPLGQFYWEDEGSGLSTD